MADNTRVHDDRMLPRHAPLTVVLHVPIQAPEGGLRFPSEVMAEQWYAAANGV